MYQEDSNGLLESYIDATLSTWVTYCSNSHKRKTIVFASKSFIFPTGFTLVYATVGNETHKTNITFYMQSRRP